ncbi:MAG TPA: EAL domain-containing protein [Candidatus Pseudogracilibacillus intestinigallinarum]|uniref:EAL domain-containing protein n=1 Tax=Candidatus Pseudogracilibacillus intestinigallinarum TaxID=2838742 RepID=A0A9D1PME5_9BACI|nr:EAL domain-containing protein [Candidatus Pseudogracilibacillus intestinigallinarum]
MDNENQLVNKLKNIQYALNESAIVAITDKTGVLTFVNDRFCETSKYSREELIGSYQNIVNSGYHSREFFKEMWRTIGNGKIWQGEIKNRAKDGTFYWVDTTIVPFLNEKGKPYEYIAIRYEITQRKEYEEKLKRVAYYDPLTGLPNRNMLDGWLAMKAECANNATISVLMIDVDRFKAINDTFSFDTGNLILKNVAKRLENIIGTEDLLIREGADKFIIFLFNVSSKKEILETISLIKQQLSVPFQMKQERVTISVSIGISIEKLELHHSCRVDMLQNNVQKADTAMYHAKEQFGNSHCFNTDDQNVEQKRYTELELGLRKALQEEQFHVVYQPIIDIKTNKINGVEALLRWTHPELGIVSPAEFIPILEEIGSIIPVGNWVLQTVIKQMKQWHEDGIFINRASINVSPIQFRTDCFVENLREMLEKEDLDPKYIDLEITEGTILDIQGSQPILERLRNLGVYVSIDDFGTGYSSLSYLKQLPISTIKIDQSFISNLDEQDEMIVNTIINLGENLFFNIVAEGVETKEQLDYLQQQDCYEGQGYYWSKPVEPEKIIEFYGENNE